MEVGGWVQVSLGIFCLNRPKIALNQWYYFEVVYHVYSVKQKVWMEGGCVR